MNTGHLCRFFLFFYLASEKCYSAIMEVFADFPLWSGNCGSFGDDPSVVSAARIVRVRHVKHNILIGIEDALWEHCS